MLKRIITFLMVCLLTWPIANAQKYYPKARITYKPDSVIVHKNIELYENAVIVNNNKTKQIIYFEDIERIDVKTGKSITVTSILMGAATVLSITSIIASNNENNAARLAASSGAIGILGYGLGSLLETYQTVYFKSKLLINIHD